MHGQFFAALIGASLLAAPALGAQAHGAPGGHVHGVHPAPAQGKEHGHGGEHGESCPHRAQHGGAHAHAQGDGDFAALQARGKTAMGVDQYTSTHRFDALPDGGRIELQRDVDDPAGVAEIRRHLREVAAAFARGDFGTPAFVHATGEVPGAAVMARKKGAITYTVRDLPRGGEVRITTRDPEALRAVAEFMAFQRSDHRAGGREH